MVHACVRLETSNMFRYMYEAGLEMVPMTNTSQVLQFILLQDYRQYVIDYFPYLLV